jgi:hypothetical protein
MSVSWHEMYGFGSRFTMLWMVHIVRLKETWLPILASHECMFIYGNCQEFYNDTVAVTDSVWLVQINLCLYLRA